MDPSAALKELRELVSEADKPETGPRMAELVQALDEWLSSGGFLPAPWRNDRICYVKEEA